MKKLLSLLLLVLILISCKKSKTELYDGIHSSAVAFAYKSNELVDFFKNPAKAYVSGFFMFEDDLADDIIFGLDVEWMEGVENYVNFEIQNFPVKLPVSPLNDMQENHWYLENEDAKIKIVREKHRKGQYAMECDANLMKH